MRPTTAINKINNTLGRSSLTSEDSLPDIQKKLKKIEPELKKMYQLMLRDDIDTRTGKETYKYQNIESIRSNLRYISDRWRCSFRIRWILDLINLKDFDESV